MSQVLKQSRVISAVEHYLGGPVEPAEADQAVGSCMDLQHTAVFLVDIDRLQEDDISTIAYDSQNREEIIEIR